MDPIGILALHSADYVDKLMRFVTGVIGMWKSVAGPI